MTSAEFGALKSTTPVERLDEATEILEGLLSTTPMVVTNPMFDTGDGADTMPLLP